MNTFKKFGVKPLLFKDGVLYASKGYSLFISNDFGVTYKFICRIEVNFIVNFFSKIPIIARIFRLGFFYLDFDFNNNLLAIVRGRLVIKFSNEKVFNTLIKFSRGSRSLNFVFDNKGNLSWGEYFSNKDRKEVHVFQSNYPYNIWRKQYTFKPNEVRHIHKIFFDKFNYEYYVLTGDYGNESAIWKSSDYLQTLSPLIRGNQKSRAVSIIIEKNRIIGATDTQLEQNYLYCLNKNGEQNLTKKITGPCFDILKINDMYFASSVIEVSKFNFSNEVILYGSLDGIKWVEIKSFVKDFYPKRLQKYFQFSTLSIVPSKDFLNRYVFFYAIGIKGYSSCLIRIEFDEIKNKLK